MTHPLNTDSLSFTHQPSICPITFHFPPFHYSSSRDHPLSITYLPVCSIHPPSVCDHPFSHPPPVNSYLLITHAHSPASHLPFIYPPSIHSSTVQLIYHPFPSIHHQKSTNGFSSFRYDLNQIPLYRGSDQFKGLYI